MSTDQEKIKDLVKERYGARAERVISLTPVELDSDSCGCSIAANVAPEQAPNYLEISRP